ncbi:DHB4-like protein [Mya arenaria]|uniref:DHB4-like protein n=1 Tax=Mya arenaria TaxID=6604 RepID=A0ABY7DQC2_MYAAR|nr:DHB4-like protein [Mya arenaria]
MGEPLRFDGKVVLVTGAGQGLGRQYAIQFAERGASVVVNDLGGSFKGEGQSTRAADKVVDEIRAKGGKAVANYDSVEFGEKLVETAIKEFGRIDIVINNAGILRDKSFARVSDLDWDLIQKVHLRGSFSVSRAAWPHMKKNNFGRIIMTSSVAGIFGNFGQANYSAAKLGLVGLSNTLAIEGRKYNITSNAVAPTAGSRLTETVMPPELVAALKPEFVAPLVLYLCHENTQESGSLFEVGGGWVAKLRWQRTVGAICREASTPMTPESVRDQWEKITDFSDSTNPTTSMETTKHLISVLGELDGFGQNSQPQRPPSSSGNGGIDVELAKSANVKPSTFEYTPKEAILYALSIGYTTRDEDHLKFLYEGSEDFSVVPSFSILPSQAGTAGLFTGGIPGLSVDVTKILHGEQYMELFKPFAPSGKLTSKARIVDVLDKGVGALIVINVDTFDEKNEKVAFNQSAIMVIGAGGFQGAKSSSELKPMIKAPTRAPDSSMAEKTSVDQVRFSKPVLPGQTLQTDMWKDGNRIFFQCKVVENGSVCLSGAYIDLYEGATESQASSKGSSNMALKSDAVFKGMIEQLKGRKGVAKKINAVFVWEITQGGKKVAEWTADMKTGEGSVYEGTPKSGKADCTVVISDDDLVDLVTGKLNGQQAFMSGKMKLRGNIMLAQKLGELFKDQAKL